MSKNFVLKLIILSWVRESKNEANIKIILKV